MPKRSSIVAVLAAVAVVCAATVAFSRAAVPAAAATTPVKIMPLGDSITGSPGCWRALLWNRLQDSGFTDIDFVGTLPPQGCAVPYDGDNEGHGGILATNMANQNQLPPWLSATRPDIVMMHLGTNDVWSNIAPATILAAFTTLVNQMRASNPAMKILVAQILPMNPSNCTECAGRVVAFNAAIPSWAAGMSTAQSPITVVDQWTGFTDATDTVDGVHPNDSGNQKISDRWYPALTTFLSGATGGPSPSLPPTGGPSPSVSPTGGSASPSAPPSPSPSTSSTAGAAMCSVTFQLVNQWPGGFQGEVIITNTGTVPIHAWVVTIILASGQQITQLWNGSFSQSGTTVTIRNADWDGILQPGQSVTIGFLGTYSGTFMPPQVICQPA